MKVERFFHIRRYHPNGGATVRVTGDTDTPAQVEVQVAFCSKKDAFCKKTGRELASTRRPKIVALRYLPQELARISQQAAKICHDPILPNIDYTYSIRYFLPKE